MSDIKVNPNFHTIGGRSVLQSKDPRFLEYRKQWASRPQSFTAGEFPLHLDIEATCLCNLKCSFCATNYEPIGGPGILSLDTFKKIIDEGATNGLCALKLNSGGRGEPLLNKALPEMIAYAKKKGIMDIYFNTNAVLLTPEISKKLIESGLDRISISFEGTTAEVYEKYRAGADFCKVLKNVKDFVQLRNEMKKERPLVRIQTVALPELVSVMDEYKCFWEKIADEVAFIDFKDYSHLNQNLIGDWACPYLWQRMMVRWDGTITICQFDYSNSYNLGNVNRGDSVRAAWRGEVMEKIRELNKKGRSHEVKICNGCAFRTTEILK